MTEQRPNAGKKHNWWKWAFFLLVAVILLTGGFLAHKVFAPVPSNMTGTAAYRKTDSAVQVNLNRKQINALSANYLNHFLHNSKIKYRFIVGPKYATLIGKTKVLGAKVQFALNCVPKRLDNGNVLLKAKGLAVGRLSLPVSFVMGYVKNTYKLPNWVSINQRQKTVLLDLNKYSRSKELHYSAKEIDMARGRFKIQVSIPPHQQMPIK
ncbi:YpmS family protein [Limosilactobacillus difficilis]|uniref:YpmS family protein n=1 Tax=Limosilactobacillus difficilis TaxID=2991838 RepID=UPI0024BBA7AC|nr:YpmS family protein [Limosilactobacillus difficilis]